MCLLSAGDIGNFSTVSMLANLNKEPLPEIVKSDILVYLTQLMLNFEKRFREFSSENHDWVRNPFTYDPSELPGLLSDVLIDLQSSQALREHWDKDGSACFWPSVTQQFWPLKRAALKVLVQFGTTYVCESSFSKLKYVKNKYRSRLGEAAVQNIMRIATTSYEPDYKVLLSGMQTHPSH